jgi:hypothetical protein
MTGKTAGDGQYSVTFLDAQKLVAKAGDEVIVTVKDAAGKLIGQSRHTITAAEIETNETTIDVTPSGASEPTPVEREVTLKFSKGINLISVPVMPAEEWRISDLAEHIGKDSLAMIIRYDYEQGKFISYLPTFPDTSPANAVVQEGAGYIVVMSEAKDVMFKGQLAAGESAAPGLLPLATNSDLQSASIFVVTGKVVQKETGEALNGVAVRIRHLRTGKAIEDVTGTLAGYGNYVATFLSSDEGMLPGDKLEIIAEDARFTIEPIIHNLTSDNILDYMLFMPFSLSLPEQSILLQNYPNPFNPETWIPFKLAQDSPVSITIYNAGGNLVRTISLGNQNAGVYTTKDRAAYWDGRDNLGEKVASGVYFYTLEAGNFRATKKMTILK